MSAYSATRCASLAWKTASRTASEGTIAEGAFRTIQRRSICSGKRATLSRSTHRSFLLRNSSSPRRFHTSNPASQQIASNPASSPDTNPSSRIPEQFRSVMRTLSHPIVVLTAFDGSHPRAMTMSSFTSLSLEPTPLITFNVATPSRTLDAVKGASEFNVHIMAGDKGGAAVADRFTRGSVDGVFDGLRYDDTSSAPVLEDGVLYVLRCRRAVEDAPEGGLVQVRDHAIVVAEVLDITQGTGEGDFALSYSERRYRKVGESI